jgi:hypothetical protein
MYFSCAFMQHLSVYKTAAYPICMQVFTGVHIPIHHVLAHEALAGGSDIKVTR